ncbi:hypothetical protein [Roseibium sediminicola]|uniref:Inner membrane protein n=1 Tax=Roseibium sediminicola TaxID=2933272 RepID=A0ABT0GRB3_9HYPH|nr:hypothetical protein [Roseibium sp. CAU 1639]MCK7611989.1 hypothetical protein [Roseibium sp. CAU 1639]
MVGKNKLGTRVANVAFYYIFGTLAWVCRGIAHAGVYAGMGWSEIWFWLSRRCRDLSRA